MDETNYDLVVVGGGIIGAATAFAVARSGFSVALVDPAPGMGSSFAAAGMLAPGAESTPEHVALTERSHIALSKWPEFAAHIGAVSATRVDFQRAGSLFVAWSDGDRRELARYFAVAATQRIQATSVARVDEPSLFSGVNPRVNDGTLVESDAFVDAELTLSALLDAARSLGTVFAPYRVVECHETSGGVEVRTTAGTLRGRCGIVATGYQDSPLELLTRSARKLRPVRGVTLRLHLDDVVASPMVRAQIDGRAVYIIRRPDGTVVVGATSDETSRDIVEASAVRRLLDDATMILPELDEAHFLHARVGLRPASSDHLPFFEELDDTGWAWSSGHYRHGFLLAPLAGDDALEFVRRRC